MRRRKKRPLRFALIRREKAESTLNMPPHVIGDINGAAVQELLSHKKVSTTMLYTHVLNRGEGVHSPVDRL